MALIINIVLRLPRMLAYTYAYVKVWTSPKGTVIRATFFFNLSCNIVVLQVETLCCPYYHVLTNLPRNKIQCCKLRQHVAQSRIEFYFLQQILVLLLVLPLKLQLVSQQIWIQRLWLAFAKPRHTANNKKKHGGPWRQPEFEVDQY